MLCFVSVACLLKKRAQYIVSWKKSCFFSRQFRNWKKAGQRILRQNETADSHKDYKKLLDMAKDVVDVGEQMSDSFMNEKAKKSANVFEDIPKYTEISSLL